MQQIELRIEGMTCNGCANRVAKAIREVAGVRDAKVDLAGASASVTCEPGTDPVQVTAAVEAKGYRAQVAAR